MIMPFFLVLALVGRHEVNHVFVTSRFRNQNLRQFHSRNAVKLFDNPVSGAFRGRRIGFT